MNTESFQAGIKQYATRAIGQSNINAKSLAAYRIPVPPLSTQNRIVAEIEAEQALVNANHELIASFEKRSRTPSPVSGAKPNRIRRRHEPWKKPPN